MRLICKKCGYVTEAQIHLEICPVCKTPMQIIKKAILFLKNKKFF